MKENPDDPRTVLCDDCLAAGARRNHRRQPARGRPTTSSRPASRSTASRSSRTNGISTCGSTARSSTPASGWASSARCSGSPVSPHIREMIAFPRMLYRLYPDSDCFTASHNVSSSARSALPSSTPFCSAIRFYVAEAAHEFVGGFAQRDRRVMPALRATFTAANSTSPISSRGRSRVSRTSSSSLSNGPPTSGQSNRPTRRAPGIVRAL